MKGQPKHLLTDSNAKIRKYLPGEISWNFWVTVCGINQFELFFLKKCEN